MQSRYVVGGTPLTVRSTSAAFGRWLDGVLSAYRASDPAEQPDQAFSIVVADPTTNILGRKRSFHIFYHFTVPIARTDDLAELARAVMAEMEFFLLRHRDDAIYLEAGRVSRNGAWGLVPSGAIPYLHRGKRRAENIGLTLPNGFYTAVDPATGMVGPVTPELEVPDDAFERLERIFDLPPSAPQAQVPARPVEAICILSADAEETPRPMSRGLTLHQMASSVINLNRMGTAAFDGLTRLVRAARCYQMAPVAPPLVVDALSAMLTEE